MLHRSRTIVMAVGVLALALVPPAAAALNQPFYVDLFRRMMIFALAALSLDLVLGYGGMVSFGHAAYLGIGAYAVGILAFYGVDNGFLQWAVAIAASAVVALVIGAISIRTSGVSFIMITLAFAQMLYYLGSASRPMAATTGCRSGRAASSPVSSTCATRTPSTTSSWRCSSSSSSWATGSSTPASAWSFGPPSPTNHARGPSASRPSATSSPPSSSRAARAASPARSSRTRRST